ncbi:MAG TPA: hypothetical protein VFL79_01515 [Terriglobia bacterium]|nr:hypothetical protein [Terriglobia bacterium]
MAGKILPGSAWAIVWLMILATAAAGGGPAAVGSLVGSRNATLDGHAPLPHTVLLSGDKVAVKDGLAMVTLDRGNRMILGRDSEAVFLREAGVLTIEITRGNLSLYHSPGGSGLRVKAGNVTVAPAGYPEALGEFALADGLLMVTARNGCLEVEKDGATRKVEIGHTLTVSASAARAPAPVPPGNAHLDHVLGAKTLTDFGMAGGTAGAGVGAIALTRSSQQVSPVMPGP